LASKAPGFSRGFFDKNDPKNKKEAFFVKTEKKAYPDRAVASAVS
jgi:hypothetical protein